MINIEHKKRGTFPLFFEKIGGKRIAVLSDLNTNGYADEMIANLRGAGCEIEDIYFPLADLVPDERVTGEAKARAADCDYVLAVGSGSLNDTAKAASFALGIPCGVLATAASMDGYCSVGAAIMQEGFKVTLQTHTPSDVLVDLDIIRKAPRAMTAAGFGDILGKFTCLADWRLSAAITGEMVDEEAYALMEEARGDCFAAYGGLLHGEGDATDKLMRALITAGLAMAKCKNSRPASGGEHHISHYLEMDFVRRGLAVPLHGFKVGIGTLVCLELYRFIAECDVDFYGKGELLRIARTLPDPSELAKMLASLGCPTRFSEIGVSRELFEQALLNAHTVRDRFTVLTLSNRLSLTEHALPILAERYY
ncbi:MAG: sn-glycerol-1-phosphate dehydrogenase [Clostridia bacterium]|nr:sn-glycerol-1-phosphate dehydrogenase [Clostridia bacterium]